MSCFESLDFEFDRLDGTPYNGRTSCLSFLVASRVLRGGDLASTEVQDRRMHAELSLARKTGENKPNCEHAARSRGLNTRDVHLGQPAGRDWMSFKQAGRPELSRLVAVR